MKSRYLKPRALALYAIVLMVLGAAAMPALATITVTPIIVVIEGRERYADVNLLNVSQKTESYALSWKFMKMVEGTGDYENIDAPLTPFDLSQNIVMTPRRVTIEANGMQKVRLGLRLKGEPPPPGDYRVHLELKQDSEVETKTNKPYEKNQMSVAVKVNVGFSIPVIYRVGESDATASLGQISTRYDEVAKRMEVHIPVTRSGGPFGILGHMLVYHDGKMIGEIKNANVFSEVNNRTFKIPLTVSSLSGGTLRIVYKHYDKQNDTVFAEKSFPVQ